MLDSLLLLESARLQSLTHAPGTLKAYRSGWTLFQSWCAGTLRQSAPASQETVLLYLTDILQLGSVGTANQRACAINYHHQQAGYDPPAGPAVHALLRGARRDRDERPQPKLVIPVDLLRQICNATYAGISPREVRDHAMITLGFSSALRRSNLAALELADVHLEVAGLVLRISREKTDQLGAGRHIGVARGLHAETCPLRAIERWLVIRGGEPGALFVPVRGAIRTMHAESVCLAVKRGLRLAGIDPALYGAHSLRAGFVTTAAENGVHPLVIAAQTGHKSLDSLKPYFRSRDIFRASAAVGL